MSMGYEQRGERGKKIRRFTVHGITLEQALLCEDDEWCDEFFTSFRKMNNEYHHRMLYLKWDVERSHLSRNIVSWELIANGKTGYTTEHYGGNALNKLVQ